MEDRQPLAQAENGLFSRSTTSSALPLVDRVPEVFGREEPGFDAFIGNPPFLGGARISEV